jgi:hypothetical protein
MEHHTVIGASINGYILPRRRRENVRIAAWKIILFLHHSLNASLQVWIAMNGSASGVSLTRK